MEELCQMFHMKLDAVCIDWIRSAVEHCELMMSSHKSRDSDIWTAMRSAFAPEKNGDKMLPGIRTGIDIDPTALSYGECGNLMTTIAQDYFVRMEYFPLMDALTTSAWTTWFAIAGLFLVFGFIYVGIFCTRKLEAFRTIRSYHLTAKERVSKSTETDGTGFTEHPTKTITIKVTETSNKRDEYGTYKFRNGLQKDLPYKRTTIEEILNSLENHKNNFKFVVSCDDEKVYEEILKFNEMEKMDKIEKRSTSSIYLRSNSFISGTNIGLSRSRIPIALKSKSKISEQ